MATATVRMSVPLTPPPPEIESVTLELSRGDALYVAAVLGAHSPGQIAKLAGRDDLYEDRDFRDAGTYKALISALGIKHGPGTRSEGITGEYRALYDAVRKYHQPLTEAA